MFLSTPKMSEGSPGHLIIRRPLRKRNRSLDGCVVSRRVVLVAGELLGMSERQFRRYRDRYEEDGLAGLVDRWLGKPSPKQAPATAAELMMELYGGIYRGDPEGSTPSR
jgi:Winged helix-turn helix